MRAPDFLAEALSALSSRAVQRDQPTGERSMARCVAIFNAWTGRDLTEAEGWRFAIALKQAREIQGNFHHDDYTDLAGYAGLLGESRAPLKPPGDFVEVDPLGDLDENPLCGDTPPRLLLGGLAALGLFALGAVASYIFSIL